MGALWQDLRFGLRKWGKAPGVTLVVVLSLALGIGANTAIFTVIDAVMLKTLPVHQPEQLVLFSEGRRWGFIGMGDDAHYDIFSYPLYAYLRDHNPAFQDVCAFSSMLERLNVRPYGAGEHASPQLAWGRLVSGNYFSVLGVRAVLGRALTLQDDRPGVPPAAVISYRYWKRAFNLDPAVIGRALGANGIVFTVVGVTPPEFFGESVESGLADLWLPVTLQPELMKDRGSLLNSAFVNWLNLIGRLKPGVRLEQAQPIVNTQLRQFLTQEWGSKISADGQRYIQRSRITLTAGGRGVSRLRFVYSRPLHILMAVVALVLLIACANVANVLLSRAVAREREITMRLAVGAGRTRLVRQLLTESVLLALLGGAVGVVFAARGVSALLAMVAPGKSDIPLNVSPDAKVLGFTLGVSLLTGILFGLAPALKATKVDLAQSLKGSTSGRNRGGRWGLAKTLVVSQVAVSLLLLVGAGLFIRTLQNLQEQNLGFDQGHVLEVGIDPRIAGYKQNQLNPLYQALLDRVNALPGVRASSLSLYSPISGDNWSGQISVEGYLPPRKQGANCQWVWVGRRYVETEGMTLLLGRDIGPQDTKGAPAVAVVNETFARRYLPNQNPIGRRFSMSVPAKTYEIEIVGVVKDFKFNDPRQNYWPVAFLPLAQATGPESYAAYLEVRSAGDPSSIAASVRQAVREVAKDLPITGMQTLTEQVGESLNTERMIARLSSFFGLLALLLASVGLYGVLAFGVARRTNEIGIRMALGARQGDILRMVLREALLLVAMGAAIGIAAAFGASRLISSQLYGLKPSDPLTIAGATILLTAIAALAGYLPARRAARVDPMVALRYE